MGGVSFYTTAKQIRMGVGDQDTCNRAIQQALDSLEITKAYGGILAMTVGHTGTWAGMQVQLSIA